MKSLSKLPTNHVSITKPAKSQKTFVFTHSLALPLAFINQNKRRAFVFVVLFSPSFRSPPRTHHHSPPPARCAKNADVFTSYARVNHLSVWRALHTQKKRKAAHAVGRLITHSLRTPLCSYRRCVWVCAASSVKGWP